MKVAAALLLLLLGASCRSEPTWRNVEEGTESWRLGRSAGEVMVSPVLAYSDLTRYMEERKSEGWSVAGVDAAGPEFLSCYLVTLRR